MTMLLQSKQQMLCNAREACIFIDISVYHDCICFNLSQFPPQNVFIQCILGQPNYLVGVAAHTKISFHMHAIEWKIDVSDVGMSIRISLALLQLPWIIPLGSFEFVVVNCRRWQLHGNAGRAQVLVSLGLPGHSICCSMIACIGWRGSWDGGSAMQHHASRGCRRQMTAQLYSFLTCQITPSSAYSRGWTTSRSVTMCGGDLVVETTGYWVTSRIISW